MGIYNKRTVEGRRGKGIERVLSTKMRGGSSLETGEERGREEEGERKWQEERE